MADLEQAGPTSHSVVSQRLRLNYLDWGNPDAPTLILQHGGRDHARSWDWAARALRKDWHVIAPDLRGHGDSAWSPDGAYNMLYYVHDMAQIIHQLSDRPVSIVSHSLGGAIALRYAGLYPENVRKLVVIEGVGNLPARFRDADAAMLHQKWRTWIEQRREIAGRMPKRYASIEEALLRMQEENRRLSDEQARHLTLHGMIRNEDGSYSWKFDNYVRTPPPYDLADPELHALWGRIECPTLLMWGRESWAVDPEKAGLAAHFKDVKVSAFDGASHWLHHDRLDQFLKELNAFLWDLNAKHDLAARA